MTSKIWRISERPEFEVEYINGSTWAVWGPCNCSTINEEGDCVECGDTKNKVVATCGSDKEGRPVNSDMVREVTGLVNWTPVRIQ